METTRVLAGMAMHRGAAVCLLILVALILAALISACSDSPEYVKTAPDDVSSYSVSTQRTPAVSDEIAATTVTDLRGDEDSEIQKSSQESARNRINTATPSSNEKKPIPEREYKDVEPPPPSPQVTLRPETGPLGLDERILRADIIARATLSSISTSTPFLSDTDLDTTTPQYVSTVELRFDAHEYLKGSGGLTLTVALPVSFREYYPSELEAVAAAAAWLPERDTRWDDREAIVFLQEPIGSLAESHPGIHMFSIYDLFYGEAHDYGRAYAIDEYYVDTYSIRSEKNKLWLPATSAPASGASGASGAGEASYYLEEPPSSGTSASGASGAWGQSASVSSITLSDMKSRVQAMNTLVEQGEGVTGYRRCLEEKYGEERYIRTQKKEGVFRDANMNLSSGLPAGSVLNEGRMFGGSPGTEYSRYLFAGPDAQLFRIGVEDDDTDSGSYSVVSTTTRPLPVGTYEVHYNRQHWMFIPCNYVPNSYLRWNVHVAAPTGTLHEAFFDPALDTSTSAVGADSTNGVLKPSAFTDSGGATTTIGSLKWKAGAVKMNVSPHTALTGQVLDFIELDGSVSLSLYTADATADTTTDTLSWSVASQPWEDGDTLMLRIREAPNRPPVFSASTYAFTVREDTPAQRIIGSVSAADPDAGDSPWYYITGGNEAGRFNMSANAGLLLVWKPLDYESVSSYTLSVEARDGKENGTATAVVEITVTDVAE